MPNPFKPQLLDSLWPRNLSPRMNVFTIVDGARDDRIYGAVDGCKLDKHCLYSGTLPWQLTMAAPYLIQLERDHRFTSFLLEHGWGNSWGIFLRSETRIEQLRRHFKGFLRVRDEAGRRLIFRYYDPRVLRPYLPTCWPKELETVFGPVDCFLIEGEAADQLMEFRKQGDLLVSRPIGLRTA